MSAAAPWSAGVLAGLRCTFGPSGSLLPTAPPYWSAGVLAGLRRTVGPSASLLPTAPPRVPQRHRPPLFLIAFSLSAER